MNKKSIQAMEANAFIVAAFMLAAFILTLVSLLVVSLGEVLFRSWLREQELNLPVLVYETSEPPLLYSRVVGCGDETRTHIISFTRRAL